MPSTFTFEEAIEAQPKTFSFEDVSKDVPRRYFTDISGKRAVLSPPEAQAWRKQQPVTTAKSYTAPGLEFAQKSPVDFTPDIPKEVLQGLPGWGKAALGAGQEAASFTGSMLSPLNLALLAAGPLTKAYPLVSKSLSAFFAGWMGKQAADEVGTLLNLPKEERNPMDVTKHVTRMILSGGLAAASAHDALAKAEVKLRENPKPPTGETPDAITQVQQPRSVSTQRPRDDEGGTPPGREPGGGVPGATTSETPGKPTETAPKEEAQGKPIAPAIKQSDGTVLAGKPGQKHSDVIADAVKQGVLADGERGFVDAENNFLTRKQAADKLGRKKPLQSEELAKIQAEEHEKTAPAPETPPEEGPMVDEGELLKQAEEHEKTAPAPETPPEEGPMVDEGELLKQAEEHEKTAPAIAEPEKVPPSGEAVPPVEGKTAPVSTEPAATEAKEPEIAQKLSPIKTDVGTVPETPAKTLSPIEAINTLPTVKVTVPEGATMLRGTDSKGRSSVQPISGVNKSNPFRGAGITKLEAGTIGKDKKFIPIKGDLTVENKTPISMGGRNPDDPGEISPSNLALLGSSIKTMAEQGGKPKISKAYELGDRFAQVKDGIHNTLEGLRAAGSYIKKRLEGFPEVTKFTSLLGDRHLALSESALNASRFMRDAMKGIPDKITREAISNWVDAGGDTEKLQEGLEKTKPQYKAGYRKALNLTPEEQVIAKNIQNYFEARLNDAIEAGILEDGVENYIHRYFEKDTPWKQRILSELRSGIFTGQPALAKQRVFSYDFEAEEAGYRPVKDFAKRVLAYDLALNKAIADRELVKGLMQLKTAGGDPWISVGGVANRIGGEGTDSALLVKPSVKPKNVAEYKSFDHPALRKWKWVAEDENGRPVLVQGSVLIHPDAFPKVRALFEGSRIRANPIGRTLLNVGSTVKQTMLDLSLFHQVQIGVHAAEHQRFQSRLGNMPEIDLTDPDQRGLVKGGMVIGDTTGREHFDEGLQGSSLTKHLPFGVGESVQHHKEWMFGYYIPKIKMITGLMALARNQELFPNLTPDEVYHMTADQMNAAFGELNYAMLGRSATMQDALRLTLLSPDFTEARARFIAQGATKYGGRPFFDEGKLKIGEQGKALLFGAAALYLTSRIINKLVSGEYHFEPKNAFNVLYNGKAYSLRTVQGDVLKLATEPAQFIRNRLNPVYGRTVLEAATGRDYFGRKRSFEQQTEDLAKTATPISVRGLFSGREQSLAESLMNSMGVTEHRYSPMQRIYELAEKWKERNKVFGEPGEFIYDPDKDKYRGVTLAARYSDLPAIRSEILMVEQKGATKSQIVEHYELSSTHMFTGSTKANEKKFKESLSKDQLKLYADAVKERNDIAKKIKEAIR